MKQHFFLIICLVGTLIIFQVACKQDQTAKAATESDAWGIHVRCGGPSLVIFQNDPRLNNDSVTVVVTALDKCPGESSKIILNNPGSPLVVVDLTDFRADTRAYKVALNGMISIECKGQREEGEDHYCVYDVD